MLARWIHTMAMANLCSSPPDKSSTFLSLTFNKSGGQELYQLNYISLTNKVNFSATEPLVQCISGVVTHQVARTLDPALSSHLYGLGEFEQNPEIKKNYINNTKHKNLNEC